MFNNVYSNKTILISGHTGFKGSWLSIWLKRLGARVVGLSDCVPTNPSLFEKANLSQHVDHRIGDVRCLETVISLISEVKPDFIFHLAAQAIVSTSYENPIKTITTNVLGTANILEALRITGIKTVAVIITSDKCYENTESIWGYREIDHIGGKDIYSGSKGAAEVVFHSYYNSFFKNEMCNARVVTARAGNVIGGGDWAKDRIVVDCIRAWSSDKPVEIRSPSATRPWQHVLEPLSGYLSLGAYLFNSKKIVGESFNFGPRSEQNRTVLELISDLSKSWGYSRPEDSFKVTDNIPFHEAGLLKLNCDKALFHLKWEPNLYYSECVKFTGDWYSSFYHDNADAFRVTQEQIFQYEIKAIERRRSWTL